MSQSSAMSEQSVSYFGEEVNLETALDSIFKQIQTFMNDTHCAVRTMAAVEDQDNDYMRALDLYHDITASIDDLLDLLKELKKISREVLGKPPSEIKDKVQAKILSFKQKRLQEKTQAKLEQLKMVEEKEN